jgi:hypothetical protein
MMNVLISTHQITPRMYLNMHNSAGLDLESTSQDANTILFEAHMCKKPLFPQMKRNNDRSI